jgi:PAS domain S-box-containing protein
MTENDFRKGFGPRVIFFIVIFSLAFLAITGVIFYFIAHSLVHIEGNKSPAKLEYIAVSVSFLASLAMLGFLGYWVRKNSMENKRTNEALRESERRLKFHIDNSPLGIVEWDSEFILTRWSRESEKIFGWQAHEVLGKKINSLKIIYEPDIPIVEKVIERLSGGKELTVVSSNRNYTKAGQIIECTWANSILLDDNGRMISVMSLVQDITSQKMREEAIRESERRFRLALRNAPVSIAAQDRDLRFIWNYNQRTVKSSAEVVGKTDYDLFSPEEAAELILMKKSVLDTGKEVRRKMWITRNDLRLYLDIYLEPLRDNNGEITGVGIATVDLTDLQLKSEEFRRQEIKLRQHIELLEYAPVLVRNLKDEIVMWNSGMESIYGFSREEAFGKVSHDLLKTVFPTSLAEIQDTLYTAGRWEGELLHRKKDGQPAWVSSLHIVHYDEAGKPASIIEINKDITLRKKAEEEISRLNSELEVRVKERTVNLENTIRELEAFSYSVSHDLRAPLRHMTGFVNLLTKNSSSRLDEKNMKYLKVISDSATLMGQLIDDILSYSRMGRTGMSQSSVNMGQIVESARSIIISGNGDREITWVISPLPVINGDPVMLRIVWENLISNAVKFSREKTPAKIEIGHIPQPGENIFFVRDNGVGFDMEYKEKLFNLFQRLHHPGEFEGTGLGLAITRRIIERHGGRTWAEGTLNEGAVFYFSVPEKV